MNVKCKQIMEFIEEFAPTRLAEDWDNVGLMVGSQEQEIRKILVCLDVTSQVVSFASKQKVDLIVSHHPLIFKALKRVTREEDKGRLLIQLIENNISVYSAHTNLDVSDRGINQYLAEHLGLKNLKNLHRYKSEDMLKIAVFVPADYFETVRSAMCEAGGGWIGNYSDCTFSVKGTGTFRPLEGTKPFIGRQNSLEHVEEFKLETVVPANKLKKVLSALLSAHPYEEVAYDLYKLDLPAKEYGLGKTGELEEPVSLGDFIQLVKKQLNIPYVRLIGNTDADIKRAAVFCGAFDGDWKILREQGVDVLVTGDVKYHEAADAEAAGLCIIDAGHFNTERVIVPRLGEMLQQRFTGIEVLWNQLEADPFKIC